jgi:hypothetical protein
MSGTSFQSATTAEIPTLSRLEPQPPHLKPQNASKQPKSGRQTNQCNEMLDNPATHKPETDANRPHNPIKANTPPQTMRTQ